MDYKLIVDSGSTKTDWAVIAPNENIRFSTPGINPSANTHIFDLNQAYQKIEEIAPTIKSIHYFGAGIIDDRARTIIHNWLLKYFNSINYIQIESDLLGAALATSGNKKGIINIMGTGSNSCVFNGEDITHNIPSLGYTLSNEGGGTKIGGELIKAYFYGLLPPDVKDEFETQYHLTKSQVIDHLYKRGNPTAYLAGFTPFVNKSMNKKWRTSFLFPIFQEFIDMRIKQYSQYLSYDLHFVGSIAYFYADILREILQYNNLTCSSIVQKPIDGLVEYYK